MSKLNKSYAYDSELLLHDGAAALTASGAGQVSSAAKVVTVGSAYMEGKLIIDISAIALTTDENYKFAVQGSPDADFGTAANIVDLAEYEMGAGETLTAATAAKDIGAAGERHVIPFTNQPGSVIYPYLRLYVTTAGAAESITFKAFISVN